MRESVRAVELVMGGVIEFGPLPVAERRGTATNVHDHVVDGPAGAAHELGHAGLKMHTSHDPAA